MLGMEGVTLSACVPGGKAQFGEKILDVVSDGGKIDQGGALSALFIFLATPPLSKMSSKHCKKLLTCK